MKREEPTWWYGGGASLAPWLLQPLAALYGAAVRWRFQITRSHRAPLPVVCVGNFTVGGTGKTPFCRAVRERLTAAGRVPVVLSRGYGGQISGPHLVDPTADCSRDVGDEPLLLARDGPVLVARDRIAGAAAINERFGPRAVILMDDGLQNPSLAKDLAFAVVDARRLFGNGHVFPAGPLRAQLAFQAGLVDAVVVNAIDAVVVDAVGDQRRDILKEMPTKPVLRVTTRPAGDLSGLAGAPIVAFAGIGNPERFFELARRNGADLVATRTFPDHHPITDAEARDVIEAADRARAILLTTEKDYARLAGRQGLVGDLAARARVLPIRLAMSEETSRILDSLLADALARWDDTSGRAGFRS